jgi:acyl phosphate:glycerol-3-phosphate acyltransferase
VDLPLVVICYLLGSVSFPWLIAWWHGIDLRATGTRKLGGSNLARVLGARWGTLGGGLDGLKGVAAVELAAAFGLPAEMKVLCALAAVTGQMWPLFHDLDGGRANSTGWGAILALDPIASVAPALLMLVAVALRLLITPHPTRPVPLAAILTFPLWSAALAALGGTPAVVVGGLLIFALVLLRRLTAGVTADLATAAPMWRILADRALFDRSQLQERGVLPV